MRCFFLFSFLLLFCVLGSLVLGLFELHTTIFSPAQAQETGTVFSWGVVTLVPQKSGMEEVPRDERTTQVLRNNIRAQYKPQFAQDVMIGLLENNASRSVVTRRVLRRIREFIRDLQQNTIQERLKDHVAADSIVIIRRQITQSRQYASRIREVRIGRVLIGDGQERHARVRIMGQGKDFSSHALLRIYLAKEESAWKISTIEGNLDTLLEPYKSTQPFIPTGTLGLTQGL